MMAFLFVGCISLFATTSMSNVAIMWSVPVESRAFAIGFSTLWMHLLGDVPSPILIVRPRSAGAALSAPGPRVRISPPLAPVLAAGCPRGPDGAAVGQGRAAAPPPHCLPHRLPLAPVGGARPHPRPRTYSGRC